MEQKSANSDEKLWSHLSVTSLEADIAYFDARLALVNGKAESHYQKAQIKAYRELMTVLSEMVALLRGQSTKPVQPRDEEQAPDLD